MVTEAGSSQAAIATGLLWLCSTVLFLFVDPVRGWQNQGDFYTAVAANPLLYQLPRVVLAGTAWVGLAAVMDLGRVVRHPGDRWLRWSTLLVVIGLALTGISQARFALLNPERAALYVEGDAATQGAIEAGRFTLQLDPHGVLSTLFLILWLAMINVVALRRQAWPRGACLLGCAVALLSVLGMAGRGLGLTPIARITSLVNGLAAPAWFLWVGLALRTAPAPEPDRPEPWRQGETIS